MEAGWVDCGCCAGIEWGGEYPRECESCGGTGLQYRYASGALALSPGGPFRGHEHPDYVRRVCVESWPWTGRRRDR
jgi:hypothetical protein